MNCRSLESLPAHYQTAWGIVLPLALLVSRNAILQERLSGYGDIVLAVVPIVVHALAPRSQWE